MSKLDVPHEETASRLTQTLKNGRATHFHRCKFGTQVGVPFLNSDDHWNNWREINHGEDVNPRWCGPMMNLCDPTQKNNVPLLRMVTWEKSQIFTSSGVQWSASGCMSAVTGESVSIQTTPTWRVRASSLFKKTKPPQREKKPSFCPLRMRLTCLKTVSTLLD